jgi:hypothetical protein
VEEASVMAESMNDIVSEGEEMVELGGNILGSIYQVILPLGHYIFKGRCSRCKHLFIEFYRKRSAKYAVCLYTRLRKQVMVTKAPHPQQDGREILFIDPSPAASFCHYYDLFVPFASGKGQLHSQDRRNLHE